jgi:hypothetical protein
MKVVAPVEKEKNIQQGNHRRKQKPDAKKGLPNASRNKLSNHDGIPAVHGSQPAFYQGSEVMYIKLQASLAQTGDLNHPDTKKMEMGYKMTLGISELRDYNDIKSGNYIAKTPEEQVAMAEVAKNNPETLVTTKAPSTKALNTKENVKKAESKRAIQQPTITNNKAVVKQDTVAKTPQTNTKAKPNFVALQPQTKTTEKVQKKENSKSIPENSHNTESKEGPKNKKGKNENNSEKELKIVIPETIKPVVTPRMDKAIDSEQKEVAPDSETTLNIIGLAAVAQEFRDQGQEAKAQFESQKGVIKTLKSKIKESEKEVHKSDADLQTAEKNVALKENLVNLLEKGLVTSIKRQQKVEKEVGIYQQEYNKNKDKADDLNSETTSLLGGSQKYQDPKEPDSGMLENKLKELSNKTSTIAQAISQAGNTTQKLSQEAKQAKEKNEKTHKDSIESKKVLLKSKSKLSADKQTNKKAKAELATLNPKLKQSEAEGKKLNTEANALLLDSYIIENDIAKTQNAYYANMATVEGLNSLKQKEKEKIEQTPTQLNQGDNLLVAFAQLGSEEQQIAFLRKLDKSELDLLKAKYDEVITNYDTNEAEKEALITQNVESVRDGQIGVFNNKRKEALQKPLNLVTKNLNRITGLKRLWMSVSIALSGIWNDITSISWTNVGKFIVDIFSPKAWVEAIGGSISGIWTDVSNWKGFAEDPVGMILQKAAGIANGLTTIAGVITGILGVLTLAAAVGSFFTFGALGPLTAWLGGATITMGTITFWVGAVALGLNVLNGIKNIYDIHTAKTATVLFKNSGELKSDIANSGMAILAMVGGKASKKGGASVKNLAENHPKTFGKRIFVSLKNGIKSSIVSIPKRISSVFKKSTWLKAYQGFQKAYNKVKSWSKEQFQKKKAIQNDPMRYGPYEEQVVPDRMHEKPLQVTDKKINEKVTEVKTTKDNIFEDLTDGKEPKIKVVIKVESFVTKEIKSKLKTKANEAFFWSGRTKGVGGQDIAMEIAESRGGITLEGLINKNKIEMPTWSPDDLDVVKAWEDVSDAYANQVSGEVMAVVGKELRAGNIWENIELPRLKSKINVTKITIIDPVTKVETIIFERINNKSHGN